MPAFYGDPIVLFFIGGIWVGMLCKHLTAFTWRWRFGAALSCALALIAIEIGLAAILSPEQVLRSPFNPLFCIGAVLLCALAREAPETGMGEAAAKALGDATYSIYLTHTFVLGILSALLARHGFGTAALFAVTTPAVILFGILVYRFVERPLVRRVSALLTGVGRSFAGRPPAVPASGAPH